MTTPTSSPLSGSRPIALITGAARRVGRATSLALARRGCDIVLHYHASLDEALRTRQELVALGASVQLAGVNLGDTGALESAANTLANELPRLDVLVHNASIYSPSDLTRLDAEDALRHYQVNALAPLLLTARLAPLLEKSPLIGRGAVVAMCDIHAMGRPRRSFAPYTMSKGALIEMVHCLARDLAPRIRVNGVAPGVVEWPHDGPEADPALQQAYLRRIPLGRAGTPEDAANAVAWLALDAHYVTGQIVRVDGGRFLT